MDLLCQTILWDACSWFLLFFLVGRLISLIVCSSDDDLVSGFFKEKEIKVSATFDYHVDDASEKKDKTKKSTKLVEYDDDYGEKLSEVVFNEEKNKGFEMGEIVFDDYDESEGGKKFGKKLVDQDGEEKKVVGFEDKVGGKLESVKNNVIGYEGCQYLEESHEIGVVLGSKEVVEGGIKGENSSNVCYIGEVSGRKFDRDEGVLSDDEEWEGIERSELEKTFARAMSFVDCNEKEERLVKGDVMMQMYGLQKIAMEGPCHEAQPMALKLSARAKWNAWHRLGNMTQEDAMDQYISLLSDNIPDWMQHQLSVEWKSRSSRTAVDSFPEAN